MVDLRVLGTVQAWAEDRPVSLGGRKQRLVLAILLADANHVVPQDRLIDGVWGEAPPRSARNTLQSYLSNLRRALAGCIERESRGYVIRVAPGDLDALRFEEQVARARELLPSDADGAAKGLRAALGLWRGPPYADLSGEDALRPEVARLEELRLVALEARIEADLALGRHDALVGELERLLAEHTYRERLWGLLMVALYRSGRPGEALGAYQRARRLLAEELGIDPSPNLRALEEQILLYDPALGATAGPGGTGVPHNLPLQPTSFVGREAELAALDRLMVRARLVTLTGAGGSGKTRLALRWAEGALERFADGAFLVDLAPVRDPGLVGRRVASVVGVREQPGRSLEQTLAQYLRSRRVLLLLDNCEHLVGAAARLAAHLVGHTSELRVLATSREPLRVRGEHRYPVPTLEGPEGVDDPVEASRYPAIRLFVDRAESVRPGFGITPDNVEALSLLCTRLDGIPLAIELAAARMGVLTPLQLLDRLDERFRLLGEGGRDQAPRHRTLEATIEWSYRLLEEPERRLFDRLSVFAAGFSLEAVEEICAGGPVVRSQVLDLLAHLVDKSMVQAEGEVEGVVRYGLLETLREYAASRLDGSEAKELRSRYARFYLGLAERALPHLEGPGLPSWLRRLDAEHANLRAALGWLLGSGEVEEAGRLVWAVRDFWYWRGHYTEALGWAERVMEAGEGLLPEPLRARMLFVEGLMLTELTQHEVGMDRYEAALRIFREEEDLPNAARLLVAIGENLADRVRFPEAEAVLGEAVSIGERLGDRRLVGLGQVALAEILEYRGDYPGSALLAEQALSRLEPTGDAAGISWAHLQLGHALSFQGHLDRAEPHYQESLALARALDSPAMEGFNLRGLGGIASRRGQAGLATGYHKRNLQTFLRLGDRMNVAQTLLDLAWVTLGERKVERAARLAGAYGYMWEATRASVSGVLPLQRIRQKLLEFLDPEALDPLWVEGAAMTLEEAVAYAEGDE